MIGCQESQNCYAIRKFEVDKKIQSYPVFDRVSNTMMRVEICWSFITIFSRPHL